VSWQPDSPDPDLPDVVGLLVQLQETGTSVFAKREMNFLNVVPPPDEDTVESLHNNFGVVAALLPGYCDSCDLYTLRRYECYWGAHPHLCNTCRDNAVDYFERTNRWPAVNVPDGL